MAKEKHIDYDHKQKVHFDKISTKYELHYSDTHSNGYRKKFFNDPMCKGIKVSGLNILEAMCGSGQTTEYLLARGAKVTGLDISPEMIESFRRQWPNCNAICASIFDNKINDNYFDCIFVVGGLHHLHPNIDRAIDEVYRILKPGGYFCFVEPHTRSLPDYVRRLWYKLDPLFEDNEAAIDVESIKSKNSNRFEFISTQYMGNVAYLLVLNSLAFRIPHRLKYLYTSFLISIESVIAPFQDKTFSCFAVCQWRKIKTD